MGLGYEVLGLGYEVLGLGYKVLGLGYEVLGLAGLVEPGGTWCEDGMRNIYWAALRAAIIFI